MTELEPPDQPEVQHFTWLKRLVTSLAITMILGLVILVGLALRLTLSGGNPGWPAEIALPQGESLMAVTKGQGWLAAVTKDANGTERIHILDPSGSAIRQSIEIK